MLGQRRRRWANINAIAIHNFKWVKITQICLQILLF